MKGKPAAARMLLAAIVMVVACMTVASAADPNGQNTPVSYNRALADAERVACLNPDWMVMRTAGDSMAPHYSDNAVLLVAKTHFHTLRPGMIVVYRDQDGDLVGHTLVAMNGDGWIARGQNNSINDPHPVTPENIVGVLFGVFHSSGADASTGSHLPLVVSKRYF